MIDPLADKIVEATAKYDAAAVSRNCHGIHPPGFRKNVVQIPVFIRHIDSQYPHWINVDMKRMIVGFRRKHEFRIFGIPALSFGPCYRIRVEMVIIRTRLRKFFHVPMTPHHHRRVVEHPLLCCIDKHARALFIGRHEFPRNIRDRIFGKIELGVDRHRVGHGWYQYSYVIASPPDQVLQFGMSFSKFVRHFN